MRKGYGEIVEARPQNHRVSSVMPVSDRYNPVGPCPSFNRLEEAKVSFLSPCGGGPGLL